MGGYTNFILGLGMAVDSTDRRPKGRSASGGDGDGLNVSHGVGKRNIISGSSSNSGKDRWGGEAGAMGEKDSSLEEVEDKGTFRGMSSSSPTGGTGSRRRRRYAGSSSGSSVFSRVPSEGEVSDRES